MADLDKRGPAPITGMLANPLVGLGIAGVGAFTSFLGARRQRKFFEDIQGRFEEALSDEAIGARYRSFLAENRGAFTAQERDVRVEAEARATGAAARFRRAGLSGIGETVGAGIKANISTRARRARDVFRVELLKQARETQFAEAQAIRGLLSTPYGAVSPASAAIGGAGAGLEAFQNARFAEQFAGRR